MSPVTEFENKIADFFGAPFAVAVDSCTSGVELCLRLKKTERLFSPRRTYLSIPMLANKLNIPLMWYHQDWKDFYFVDMDNLIIDAAVLWKPNSYIPGKLMSVSCQYQKHLSIGRAGVILCDNKEDAIQLKKMSYDGRIPDVPWREQDVDIFGYHYYLQPELALIGLEKLPAAIKTPPRQWTINDWPDLTQMKVFKNG